MKMLFALVLSICATGSNLFAGLVPCERTYVRPNQVHITESSIHVNIDELWIQPSSLVTDANGVYFDAFVLNEYVPGPWLPCME